jgi:hypothetical protein
LALALTSGTLVWQEIMTTSPISDFLFGENNLLKKSILSEIFCFLEKKVIKKPNLFLKKNPQKPPQLRTYQRVLNILYFLILNIENFG